MRRVTVSAGARYDVLIGEGALGELHPYEGRLAVMLDENVARLHRARVESALSGRAHEVFEVPSGERYKTLETASRAYDWLAQHRFERGEALVAIGGGVTGDLAGFVAATWRRGVPFVQVPTTILSQVDSSVGAKVAVDHPLGKNLIGAFHPPTQVLADTALLTTLPLRQRWSGLAEVVKTALLAGGELFDLVERDLEGFADATVSLDAVIERCVEHKAAVVERDPYERGERATLNFGHSVGHALELLAGYESLLHGEAVAWGMRAELALAGVARGSREAQLVRRLAVPPLPAAEVDAVLDAMRSDKKVARGRVRFALVDSAGHVRWNVEHHDDEIRDSVRSLYEESRQS